MLGIGTTEYSPEEVEEIESIRSGRFGLGTKRTLQQAIDFSGIDLPNRKMVANKCGNLVWVPFVESVEYGVRDAFRRGLTGGVVAGIDWSVGPVAGGIKNVEPGAAASIGTSVGLIMCALLLLALVVVTGFVSRKYPRKGERHKN